MPSVVVDSGICGFSTTITATSEDGQTVVLRYTSSCPHVMKARTDMEPIDAYTELFCKPAETRVHTILSGHLPHVTCPLYSGFLKAIEVAAGLALPKDVGMKIEA